MVSKKEKLSPDFSHHFNASAGFNGRAGGGGYLHRQPLLALKAGRIC
jgi:hypothetical protein